MTNPAGVVLLHSSRDGGEALAEPGCEQRFDVAAASRCFEAALHVVVLDDDDRRDGADQKALGELGLLVDVDVVQRNES